MLDVSNPFLFNLLFAFNFIIGKASFENKTSVPIFFY